MTNEEESLKLEMERCILMIEDVISGFVRVNVDPYLNRLTLATAKYLLLQDNVLKQSTHHQNMSKNEENFDR